ncbi:hypothetical protein [Erythrobacter cryptus]|uniref:hypothetical protein n=1 Tax=Erythrobacter cryptus TaxID=196588 RepID=UPI0004085B46|nr:hypothetical protein [Erythrobacter cryptus]
MKKFLVALAFAAAAPVAMTASAPAALAQDKAEGEFKIPTPPEGKGQVIFYRTGGISGAALGCAVFDAGAEDKLSSLGAGKYFVLVSDPGPRSFTVKSLEAKDAMTLEIEEGETQFVRCKIKAGFMSGRADIAPSNESEFRSKYKTAKLVDADDMSAEVKAMNYPQ